MRVRSGLAKLVASLLVSGLMAVWASAPASAQAIAVASSPDAVIREFYAWYVHEVLKDKDPLSKERMTMRKYVTLRLIREIDRMAKGPDGLDGDYFLDAQDFDDDWQKNITVSNLTVKYGTATATVALKGKEMNRNLKVTLRHDSSGWKIDRVKGVD